MHKPNAKLKLVLVAAISAAFITGCGNGSSTSTGASTDINANVGAMISYVEGLIAKDGNSDPVDVNAVTLVQDNTAEPSAVRF